MREHLDELRIEPIKKQHDVKHFDCGENLLNTYLSRFAFKNDHNNIAKTFVLVDRENVVHGYFSICAASIEFQELSKQFAKKLPKYPIPSARLARLAISNSLKGYGMGERLLIDALQRIHKSSSTLAIKFIIVDALHEDAKLFYLHYGFKSLPDNELALILPIETINKLF